MCVHEMNEQDMSKFGCRRCLRKLRVYSAHFELLHFILRQLRCVETPRWNSLTHDSVGLT